MHRGIKLAGVALVLGSGVALAACASSGSGSGVGSQIASCKGGYPDGGALMDMSPYSPNANPSPPPCEST